MNDKLMIKSITGRCLAVRTLSAARAISRRYDTALRPVGLTITQFTLLAAIAQTRPNSISEIAERLSMERTSLTRGAKLLEASDLIERSGEAGTRKRALRITDKGLSLLREAYPLWEKAQLETEALLGDEIDETNRFLNLLRNGPLS
ncbi:MAG TPA: MarR family transcriptional regulator [Alteromonas australica]|jgi:DNA-binding MarR family transcriptional regulator|uniref:MarR family transcriptional regulator n=2 Tax=Pseudomonadota TaxID=1224 RepID=A0A350P9B4_9ALTE|nr:MarR family transcriptional regulator [Alteromonas sp.]HAW77881.1 MarR family transcriptional regulator [Alteromonas australica]|tara:strand:- start:66504 stop:66944 length:441 start_codon:yes stop_codon:yes gene_type:complete